MKSKISYLIGILIIFYSCEKEAGEGGTSSIEGKITANNIGAEIFYNPLISQNDTLPLYPVPDQDVYIIYGEGSIYDDSFETSWDGTYRFDYLRKGTYNLFTYSDCDTCDSGKLPVFWTVNITQNNKRYYIDDVIIKK